mgnify:CR=1 FL=1
MVRWVYALSVVVRTRRVGGPKIYITIEGGNTSTQAPSGFEQFGQQIGSFVEKKYRELMAQDMRPGGMVWNAVKGQR